MCFHARFYYPVFTILFLDYGLTIGQFALLNAVWAAAIVGLEVPTGALADAFGRRRLVIAAAGLMVAEMLLLGFAPRGRPALLFAVMLLNRLLSGAAEAAASGADEALAYDSLKQAGLEHAWPRVLERLMRRQAMAVIAAMVVGAAAYDPEFVGALAAAAGWPREPARELSLRLPAWLTLFSALGAVIFACGLREAAFHRRPARRRTSAATWRAAVAAARWVRRSPPALMLILIGLSFDSPLRMLVTLISQYYRLIHLPEAAFGLIGGAMALLGLVLPSAARRLADAFPAWSNFAGMALVAAAALFLLARFIPIYGLAPAVAVYSVLVLNNFFLSSYLNRIAPSAERATVLSLKGLGFNLAYGSIGLLYSLAAVWLRPPAEPAGLEAAARLAEDAVFVRTVGLFPWLFAPCMAALLWLGRKRLA
jgi:MFS family permease